MIRTSRSSSSASSAFSAVDVCVGESSSLRRLIGAAAISAGVTAGAGLLAGSPAQLAAGAALVLVSSLLRRLDPEDFCLREQAGGYWLCGVPGAMAPCKVHSRGRFLRMLLLEVVSCDGARRQTFLLFGDALADGDWRRLRRSMRIQEIG